MKDGTTLQFVEEVNNITELADHAALMEKRAELSSPLQTEARGLAILTDIAASLRIIADRV